MTCRVGGAEPAEPEPRARRFPEVEPERDSFKTMAVSILRSAGVELLSDFSEVGIPRGVHNSFERSSGAFILRKAGTRIH